MGHKYYGRTFYDGLAAGSLRSAEITLRFLFELYRPRTVVDFGCGAGTWLRAAKSLDVADIVGVDGDHVTPDILQIPVECFVPCNLADQRPQLATRFDLAMCLEVAEHLPASRAQTFVDDLTAASDVVLFSAAIPDQGGRHHVNEQFPSYWITLFGKHGYNCYDAVRPAIWSDRRVEVWYRQNILLFSRTIAFPGLRSLPSDYDLVHPEFWTNRGIAGKFLDRTAVNAKHFLARTAPRRLVSLLRRR